MPHHPRLRLLAIALIALVLGGLLPNSQALAASNALDVRLRTSFPVVSSGDWAVIQVDYSCSSIIQAPCQNVVISSVIPPELARAAGDVRVIDLGALTTASYSPASATATWAFKAELSPGDAGTFELQVRFAKGSTPNGAVATLRAQISAANAPPSLSRPLPLTASAQARARADKRFVSGGVLDLPTVYQVAVCVPSPSGAVDLTSVVMTDTMPVGATFLAASDGGSYNAGANTISWPAASLLVSAGQSCLSHSVTLAFPDAGFNVGDEIQNRLSAEVTALNGATFSLSDSDTRLIQPPTPNPGFSKSGPSTAQVGDTVRYSFDSRNSGTSPLDNHSFTDVLPAELRVTRIFAAGHNQPGGIRVQIDYQTSQSAAWAGLPGAPFSAAACVNVAPASGGGCAGTLTLSAGEYITALRYTYLDQLPYGFAVSGGGNGFEASVVSAPANQIIVNTADAVFTFNGHQIHEQSSTRARVIETQATPGAQPSLTKAVSPGLIHAGELVTYTLTLRNTSVASITTDLLNPQLVDLLQTSLIYLPGSQQVTAKPAGAPDPAFDIVPNFNGTGRALLRWRWLGAASYSLPAGQTISLRFQARVAPYTPAGSLSNTAYLAGWDNLPGAIALGGCSGSTADVSDFDGDGDTSEQICSSSITNVTLATAASSGAQKLVKGQLDNAWTFDPQHGFTIPGGSANYRLIITNTGTIAISDLILLDILPWVGDVGVQRFDQARGSEWRPFLVQPIAVPAGASVFYSTQNNPCRQPDLGIDPDAPGCGAPAWRSDPPADITSVQSFKISFGGLVLSPGDSVEVGVRMRAPYGGTAGQVAWNSFGYRARAVGASDYLLAPDPPRVGIERQNPQPPAYGNYVWLDQNKDGRQTSGEPGVNGARIDLFRDDDGVAGPSSSDTPVDFTVSGPDDSGNPGYYLFSESFPASDPRYPAFLAPGSYYTRVTPPPGYGLTAQDQGADDAIDSDVSQATHLTPVTTLDPGEVDLTWDVGLTASTAVGNYVWLDRNQNGLQDEPPGDGLNGVGVNLRRASDNGLVATTTTADDRFGRPGSYLFDGLTPGDYYVEFIAPSGFGLAGQDSGDDAQDSDASPTTGRTASFSLAAEQYNPTLDAGLTLPTGGLTLGNLVWRDQNNDGRYEPTAGEHGIDGVRLDLFRDANANGQADAGEGAGSVTTSTRLGQPGWYQFAGLAAGDYLVAIDASNFGPGGALVGLRTSTGNEPTPDPDAQSPGAQIDGDDSGDLAGGRIVSQAITLTSGGEPGVALDGDGTSGNQTLDFGLIGGAALGNLVWLDADGNGVQDAGEPGVPGVTAQLLSPGGAIIATTTTDATGRYGFSELSAGSYRVRFSGLPAGHSFTGQGLGGDAAADSDADPASGQTALITLADGQADLSWDVGLVSPLASIGDRAWDDQNLDGVQDAGEPGINGVSVALYRADGAQVGTTTTTNLAGVDGSYGFANLPPGDYYVVFTSLPAGYTVSPTNAGGDDAADSDADRITRRAATTTLSPGENDSTWDIGIFSYASIGDRVWKDTNRDGVQDAGEPGVPGVTVQLYRPGSSTPAATTTTSSSGIYRFTNLAPADYYLEFALPAGYHASPRDAGGDDASDSDPSLSSFQTSPTTLDPGEDDTSWDFGIFPTASIGDRAWLDRNANGLQDSGEVGVPGVDVILLNSAGAEIDSTVTDATGLYRFSDLIPGVYSLAFVPPSTFALSPQDASGNASDAADSDVAPGTLATIPTTLDPGESDQSWDIGLYQISKLGDLVWDDLNADGVQDSGEPGIPGVTVRLYRPGPDGAIGGGDDILVDTQATDASGTYRFVGLPPAVYYLAFDLPTGYTHVSPSVSAAADSTTDSDADPTSRLTPLIDLGSSSTDLSWDMGVYKLASLGDRVWLDSDVDGVQGAGEAGVNGVSVTLYRSDGTQVATTTTASLAGSDGVYGFAGLTPGSYYLIYSGLPAGHAITRRDQGADDAQDSDVGQIVGAGGAITGASSLISLASGQADQRWDAGIYPTIMVGDRVWLDEDADGVQDPAETTGVDGVRVELRRAGDNSLADVTFTDNAGNYLFSDLFPDTYRIVFSDIPAGYQRSPQDRGSDDAQDSDADAGLTTADFTPSAGSDLTRDLGLYQPASLGDLVWHDLNANGVQDAGEPAIAGAAARLYSAGADQLFGGGDDAQVGAAATTDASGHYSFTGLTPGFYYVQFDLPAGYDRASAALRGGDATKDSDADPASLRTAVTELRSGENDPTWDAGFYPLLRLGDLVWDDLNNDGLKGAGESGIDGVTLNLSGTDGAGNAVSQSTTTAGGGRYQFGSLVPGDYRVELPASNFSGAGALAAGGGLPAYRSSTGTNGSATGPYEGAALADPDGNIDGDDSGSADASGNVRALAITLRPQDEPLAAVDGDDANGNQTVDFGLFRPLSLGDLVWNDLNDNKAYDGAGEGGIDGVSVQLYRDSDANNAYTAGTDTLVASASTASGGLYQFTNLAPGSYVVVIPATNFAAGGALHFFRSSDAGLATDSATDPDTGDVNSDDNGVGPSGGVVSGLVSSGAVSLSQGGEPTDDGDASSNSNLSLDFGFYSLGVGNMVFQDKNNNGLFDGADAGINGRTVSLYYDADSSGTLTGGETTAVASIATSNGGHYFFGGLRSGGSYQIGTDTGGAGWVSSSGGANGVATGPYEPGKAVSGDATDGDDNGTQAAGNTARSAFFTPAAGGEPTAEADQALPSATTNPAADASTNLSVDFGLFNQARVGDKVWLDANGNGVQDGGEAGVGGVTASLYDSADALVGTATTTAAGAYGFSYLLPGSYYVVFSNTPAADAISPKNNGGTAATNSDADPATGRTASFTLAANANDTSWDMGLYPLLSLGNLIWDDLNDNGLFDSPTESGISGVTVELYRDTNGNGSYDAGADAAVASQATVAGSYLFTGLTQGDYLVVVPASAFAGGQPLALYRSSTGANGAASGPYEPAADPDNNLNADDNGGGSGGRTVTRAISLAPGAEPTNDGDADPNTNLTLDLGFFQPLSLGNLVWDDRNNDGLLGGGESGIAGVSVKLYADTNGSGSYEAGTDALVASTTTGTDGAYSFSDLIPGGYLVVLPAGNVAAGQPLAGYLSSTGANAAASGAYEPAPDPDDPAGAPAASDRDGDDNGARLAGGDIAARAVTLSRGAEPDTAADGDGANANQTVDFGLFKPASLGDTVWHDVNANGVQDAGEPGIDGVGVGLYDAADTLVASTATAGGGRYGFTSLIAGDYYVVFGATAGYSQVSPQNAAAATAATDSDADWATRRTATTSLSAGESDPSWDLGVYNPASIGDLVWEDANGNGRQDAGEPGLDDVAVSLYSGGGLLATTTTAGGGAYSFSGLTPGSYGVVVTPPTGYAITLRDNGSGGTAEQVDSDADRASGAMAATTLSSGENDRTWDAGLYRPASLGDLVWHDVNANGAQDAGEPGIASVGVTLRWAGPDGALGTADDTTAAATTDADGRYRFAGLLPGDYDVVFGATAGYSQVSAQNAASATAATDSDADRTTRRTAPTSLTTGESDPSWDLGVYSPASIGDLVWEDRNGDGVQDAGEPGVAGVAVGRAGGGGRGGPGGLTTTTAADGTYRFASLAPGDYAVTVTAPAGASFSGQNRGADDTADSDADTGSGAMASTTLSSGEDDRTWDAGIYRPASLGDRVWEDLNGDGIQGAGEPGVPGVAVTLYEATSDAQVGAPEITDASGYYKFVNLAPSRYYLVFSNLPAGYRFTPAGQGGDRSQDSDADPASGRTASVDLLSSQDDPTWDAGIYTLASLGDRVWDDLNGDGRQDADEPGVNGVSVALTRVDGTQVLTATTATAGGVDGVYRFTGLTPGSYVLTFDGLPAGAIFSPQDVGGDTGDSDVDPTTGRSASFLLASGADDLRWDAGTYLPASLGNRVWEDRNANGIFDGDEAGVPGVRVELYHSDGAPAGSVLTDSGGGFMFRHLGAGAYYLVFYPPEGWKISPRDQGGNNGVDSDADPVSGRTAVFSLGVGALDLSWWAGLARPPTAITLLSFTMQPQAHGNLLRWESGAELNTAGYQIYRSTTGRRADAALVSGPLIVARGVGAGGARYSWLDAGADAGADPGYWLVEVEIGGARHEYRLEQPGLRQTHSLWLPLLAR